MKMEIILVKVNIARIMLHLIGGVYMNVPKEKAEYLIEY
jgi:hypothetical protein